MKRQAAMLVLASFAGMAGTAHADETTFCNAYITSLPYTVSAQGHYCFVQNLSTAITTGNAITINADFVVLDLNNFKLGGSSAGLGTHAVGVYSSDHRNITVRNGNIRGFYYGIRLTGSGGGHLIENNLLDGNTFTGALVSGDLEVVRNNGISNTGGSTVENRYSYGVHAYGDGSAPLVSVFDNVISNTFATATSGGGHTYGIALANGVADHNLVNMGTPAGGGDTRGIGTWGGICRDNTTLNATVANTCAVSVGFNYP